MDYYLFAARSVTHAQRMARLLSDAGISAKIHRAALRSPSAAAAIRWKSRAATRRAPCRPAARGGVLPVKVLFVSDDGMQEVAL